MDTETLELKERISKLSDEELLNMVEVEPHEYRRQALDFAKNELMARGVQFQEGREALEKKEDSIIHEAGEMKKLVTCADVAQAGLLNGLLAEIGILCEMRGASLAMASGVLPPTECYPELWVAGDEDLRRAKEFLREWQGKEDNQHESWICEGCGEENEGQFNSCWKCGHVETDSNRQPRA